MGSKRMKITNSSLPDRISDLPSSIIDRILDRLPIRNAVATSILSKQWRHRWRTISNLVFDKKFVDDVIVRRLRRNAATIKIKHEYICIVGSIMLLHIGPIQKLVLHIPYFGDGFPSIVLNSWMLFLSQNKVKELTIDAPHSQIRLPSYFFHCNELQHLKVHVRALDLYTPQDFGGFRSLRSLYVNCYITDVTQISSLISQCPLLEKLTVRCLSVGQTLVIDAPRLLTLGAYCSMEKMLKLKNVHSVTRIGLRFDVMKLCDLLDILGSVPNVVHVSLDPLCAVTDMPGDAPTRLPITLLKHQILSLHEIDISSPQCIYFILCIFRSSPKLRKLNLWIHPKATNEEGVAALHCLDMQTREPQILKNLSTVNIKRLSGSKAEIMFIKFILSCCPALNTLYLTGENIVNEAEVTMMSELLKCQRTSPQAQIHYSRHPEDKSS